MIDPDSVRTEYSYDELNRIETLTFGDGQQVAYEYFPDGLKKTVTNPNGTTSTYDYDAADRMTEIAHTGPSGVVSAYHYFYDPNSNRERQVETNAGRTETTEYTYDFVNRLKTVTYPDKAVEYEYDLAGNRIQEVTTGAEASDKTFHYDAINRLEKITDTASGAALSRYAYDPNGNTTEKTAGGVTTTFHFDIRDQLGEVRQGSSVLGRYGYDYDGRRILKIGDDGRRQYTYDQLSVITEADQVNATVSKYDYGMDQLVRLDNRNEGRSFFHLDFLGSTVGLTDAAGSARQSIFYDAWGNERDRVGASANRFTFTGQEIDRETGLYYFKARFYDAETGRFLSQDDVLGEVSDPPDLHLYAYAQMNPLVFVDPTGNIEFIKEGLQEGVRDVSELVMESSISLAENETVQRVPLLSRAISSTGGTISGGINFVNSVFGLVNFGGNLAVGALSFLSPESSVVQQSAKEITETFDQLSNTARVVKETGGMNTAMGIAKSGGDKFFQALKGDPRANAEINALGAEIAAGVLTGGGLAAASKGTATQVTKKLAEETLESTGKLLVRSSAPRISLLKAAAPAITAVSAPATTLSPLSRVARTVLRPVFERVGRATTLPYRTPFTTGVRLQRTLVTATKRHASVGSSPIGRLLQRIPGLELEQGHVFLQQRWWRAGGPTQWYPGNAAANLGLRRLGNAGWNLMPMPRSLNRWLGSRPWASFGYGLGTAGAAGASGYGGYKFGEYLAESFQEE